MQKNSAITCLRKSVSQNIIWGRKDRPFVVVDGHLCKFADIDSPIRGKTAHVFGVNEKSFPRICEFLSVESVFFRDMRVANLDPLIQLASVSHLGIEWNTKAVDVSCLKSMASLKTLILSDTPKITDLSPLTSLQRLSALEFSGGMWNKNRADTLAPLATLKLLRELVLLNVQVKTDGLRPIGECASLQTLTVSNQFSTEDFAYLSVRLPTVQCDHFAPFITIGRQEISEQDIMVVGKRKPFLNSRLDADRLAKYEAAFRELQRKYTSERT